MEPKGSVLDVISGKESIKVSVAMDYTTIAILCAGIFLAVIAGIVVTRIKLS